MSKICYIFSIFLTSSVINDVRPLMCDAGRHLYIARIDGQHTSDAYRPSVDGTLLPAVMDQIFVENRDSL